MVKYGEAVKYMGQTLEDYIAYMKEPGNKGDELSLHSCAHVCQKQVAVVTKTNVYYTEKLNSCDDFIQILDCDMVLVYLGKGVFHGTKEKPLLHRSEPKTPVPRLAPLAESPPQTTPEPSDTEAALDSSPAPPT